LQEIVTTNTTKVQSITVRTKATATLRYTSGGEENNGGGTAIKPHPDRPILGCQQVALNPPWLGESIRDYNSQSSFPLRMETSFDRLPPKTLEAM